MASSQSNHAQTMTTIQFSSMRGYFTTTIKIVYGKDIQKSCIRILSGFISDLKTCAHTHKPTPVDIDVNIY